MNLPNKLTMLRIIMIPICIAFLMIDAIPHNMLIALCLFIAASATDALDGKIARKYNLITDFGKFMDPLADKMLVCSVLICFIEKGIAPAIAIVCIIFREFAVSSLRLVAVNNGKVIAANIWGKMKTVSQMTVIAVIMAFCEADYMGLIPDSLNTGMIFDILMWITAAITLISGVTYIIDNRDCIKEK